MTLVKFGVAAAISIFIVTLLVLQCRSADAPQYPNGGVTWVSAN